MAEICASKTSRLGYMYIYMYMYMYLYMYMYVYIYNQVHIHIQFGYGLRMICYDMSNANETKPATVELPSG